MATPFIHLLIPSNDGHAMKKTACLQMVLDRTGLELRDDFSIHINLFCNFSKFQIMFLLRSQKQGFLPNLFAPFKNFSPFQEIYYNLKPSQILITHLSTFL